MTTLLNFALALLVFLSVGFGFLAIWRQPRVPVYAAQAMQDNNNIMKLRAILNDALAYNATARSPELARILQVAQQKPAAH